MSGSVHIVIVNWNTGRYLTECLESIILAERADVTIARVTVVDNASSDESAKSLDDLPLPLELVHNSRNVGFAAASNQGAADSTADYLLFLNPDTRLFPDTLAAVTAFMDSEQAADIGICGVQVVGGDGSPAISCARFPTLRVLLAEMTGLHLVLPQLFPGHQLTAAETTQSQLVDQVIGAFYLVRRDLFARLGGFDERYFLYFEEVDFALRACQQGTRSYFLKEAEVFHAENVSSNQVRGPRLYHSLRSRFLFAYQHWPRWQAHVLLVLTLTVELTARLTRAAWHGSGPDISAIAFGYGKLLGNLRSLRSTMADGPHRDRAASRVG
jgi:N-acetylglucosaminyl-diphospho-decaprenol L-rhamnosyltransferase